MTNDGQLFMTNDDLQKLSNKQLAERVCLLDLLDEMCREEDFEGIEDRLGMSESPVRLYELTNAELREKVDEVLKARIKQLRADIADTQKSPPLLAG